MIAGRMVHSSHDWLFGRVFALLIRIFTGIINCGLSLEMNGLILTTGKRQFSVNIYQRIVNGAASGRKMLAILIDPDKARRVDLDRVLRLSADDPPDFFFIGGSLITQGNLDETVRYIKDRSRVPVVLFPGNHSYLSAEADALLLLSLISGRNAEYLIGQHVTAAPFLKKSGLEIMPTGYMLVHCGNQTTVSYISNTTPIPYDKPEIASTTALAGELLGLKLMYLDGGSGAKKPVSPQMLRAVSQATEAPLILGGGIRTTDQAIVCWEAGADVIVIGTAIEENPDFIARLADARKATT